MKVLRLLGAIALALFACGLISKLIEFSDDDPGALRHFDATREDNVATVFAAFLLLLVGVICLAAARRRRAAGEPMVLEWAAAGLLLVVMAIDEVAQFHEESAGAAMDAVESLTGLEGNPARALVVLTALVFFALVAFRALPWLRSMPRERRRALIVAGAVYFGAAFALEIVGRLLGTAGAGRAAELLEPFEELMEMFGALLAIRALLPEATGEPRPRPEAREGSRTATARAA